MIIYSSSSVLLKKLRECMSIIEYKCLQSGLRLKFRSVNLLTFESLVSSGFIKASELSSVGNTAVSDSVVILHVHDGVDSVSVKLSDSMFHELIHVLHYQRNPKLKNLMFHEGSIEREVSKKLARSKLDDEVGWGVAASVFYFIEGFVDYFSREDLSNPVVSNVFGKTNPFDYLRSVKLGDRKEFISEVIKDFYEFREYASLIFLVYEMVHDRKETLEYAFNYVPKDPVDFIGEFYDNVLKALTMEHPFRKFMKLN